ncbi:histidine kinase [Natrarchaeobius halalkaliphilus]|uniref:histidine kinase n=1 Tax=Natrarchaeobius halalkaliphilus TaxID=1679091 RepID=A0A3N6M290_9EURY|nr:ATP-binding protein [Natrarchaeobius halalkaliphilus]RQG89920.1 histidine kinase [Natrarchaeobius halalkaliphilus]
MAQTNRFGSVIDGRTVIFVLGVFYIVVAVVWGFRQLPTATPHSSVLVISAFIGGSGAVLCLGGYRLSRTDIDRRFYATIARWCLGGIVVMSLILVLYHVQPTVELSDPVRSVSILTGFSSVAGFGVGVYDAKANTRALELERQNRRLEKTREELSASNERLEQFASAASHDLQEPLRMVSRYLHLIENRYRDDLDEDGEEFLEYAIDGAERMTRMIDALLEYSRVDTRGEEFEPVDLSEVVSDVREDMVVRIEETGAQIAVDELPRVDGDRSQLRQLFQNLLSNAMEYSGDDRPRIEISAERERTDDPSGDRWILSVRDHGIGIDPADQERIFEVFQRLHSHEEHPGTGIGLALCSRIVERHGGEIWIDSALGRGTTVSFSLSAVSRHRSVSGSPSQPP